MKTRALVLLAVVVAIAILAVVVSRGQRDDVDHAADLHDGEVASQHDDDHAGHDHGAEDADADDHTGHDHGAEDADADDHADDGEGGRIVLSELDRKDAGIRLAIAGPGHLELTTRLLGEVRVNEERLAHVVPPVSGVVREVKVRIGDEVSAGDLLAVVASRELAEARAQYMNARGRRELKSIEFDRQKELWSREIMAEQDYLNAGQALSEADIELQTAEQTLHALGVEEEALEGLSMTHDAGALTRLELRAPLGGTVIEMHMVMGEVVDEDSDVLAIADLSTVWIDLDVPQADLSAVHKGQRVTISAPGIGIPEATGVVSFVSPIIDEETRTALARIEIPNESMLWRPGLFVTAEVSFERLDVPVLVPRDAVQTLEGEPVVFVCHGNTFESVPVALGSSTRTHVEIVSGLSEGDEFVAEGAYALKAEIVTSGLDSHAGHGH
ncbi:MAG: efflux RND transporter periplasmic adaptor subunit [Candidatus Eisenbacteria bacterium]